MLSNRFSPYGKYNGNEVEYAIRALDSESADGSNYPWVSKLEEDFSVLSGFKYSIAVNSGTSGLHAALVAAGVQEGDEVIQYFDSGRLIRVLLIFDPIELENPEDDWYYNNNEDFNIPDDYVEED